MTASASRAKLNGAWEWTTTPFMDATRSEGQTIRAFSSGCLTRFDMAEAINESSSLKPSKVRMAIRTCTRGLIRDVHEALLHGDSYFPTHQHLTSAMTRKQFRRKIRRRGARAGRARPRR